MGQGRRIRPWPYLSSPDFPLDSACLVRRPFGSLIFAHCAQSAVASRCYGWPLRLSCLCTCMAASPPHEKNPRMGANARRVRDFRGRPGYVAKPSYPASTMLPTAQHQHASSRAIATLATLDCLPAASVARRLSTSRLTPALACLRAAGGAACPITVAMQLVPQPICFSGYRDYDCVWSEWTADRAPADGLLPLPLEGPGGVADAGVAVSDD